MYPRRLGYDTLCLTCDGEIAHDERAYVERGVGAWHEDCPTPLNLRIYRRERERGARRKRPQRRQHSNVDDTSVF